MKEKKEEKRETISELWVVVRSKEDVCERGMWQILFSCRGVKLCKRRAEKLTGTERNV